MIFQRAEFLWKNSASRQKRVMDWQEKTRLVKRWPWFSRELNSCGRIQLPGKRDEWIFRRSGFLQNHSSNFLENGVPEKVCRSFWNHSALLKRKGQSCEKSSIPPAGTDEAPKLLQSACDITANTTSYRFPHHDAGLFQCNHGRGLPIRVLRWPPEAEQNK